MNWSPNVKALAEAWNQGEPCGYALIDALIEMGVDVDKSHNKDDPFYTVRDHLTTCKPGSGYCHAVMDITYGRILKLNWIMA